jgi:hypothetical protein
MLPEDREEFDVENEEKTGGRFGYGGGGDQGKFGMEEHP